MSKVDVTVIAAVTGLIGTISGSAIAYLTLRNSIGRDKHKVNVKLGKNLMLNVPSVDREKEQLTIQVANLGKVPFKVVNVGVNVGRRSGGIYLPKPFGTHQLPVDLERDQTCNFWTDYDRSLKSFRKYTRRNRVKIRASISDYTGRTFYSDWMKIRFKDTPLSKLVNRVSKATSRILKLVSP